MSFLTQSFGSFVAGSSELSWSKSKRLWRRFWKSKRPKKRQLERVRQVCNRIFRLVACLKEILTSTQWCYKMWTYRFLWKILIDFEFGWACYVSFISLLCLSFHTLCSDCWSYSCTAHDLLNYCLATVISVNVILWTWLVYISYCNLF